MSQEETNLYDDINIFKSDFLCDNSIEDFICQNTSESSHLDCREKEIESRFDENMENIDKPLSLINIPEPINEILSCQIYEEKEEEEEKPKDSGIETITSENDNLYDKCSCITIKNKTLISTKAEFGEDSIYEENLGKGRKKGRFKKRMHRPTRKYHSRNRKDNIKNKIKIHFMNFIIYFTNAIIKGEMFHSHNILFRQLPHSVKKDVHIETNKLFLKETIEDLLIKYGVSSKYKNKDESNISSLEKIQKKIAKNEYKSLFHDYLRTNIKTLYTDFYYSNNIEAIIKKYKINRDRSSKLEFLNELIDKYRDDDEDQEYLEKFKKECKLFISDFENKISRKKR